MKNIFLVLLLAVLTNAAFANQVDLAPFFAGKEGCFILFDQKKNENRTYFETVLFLNTIFSLIFRNG